MCLHRKEKGWTLIELMIVVIIIAILLAVAVVLFGGIIDRSRESATKGSLGALRSSIKTYYADYGGVWPEDLKGSFEGKYIDQIPFANLRRGIPMDKSAQVVIDKSVNPAKLGGWLYNSDTGHITVNHNEKDTKDVYYSTY